MQSSPSHEMLVELCRLYHVSSDYLLGLTDEDPAYTHRRRQTRLSDKERAELKTFEDYLLWKRRHV